MSLTYSEKQLIAESVQHNFQVDMTTQASSYLQLIHMQQVCDIKGKTKKKNVVIFKNSRY